jgi:hypothetical protein
MGANSRVRPIIEIGDSGAACPPVTSAANPILPLRHGHRFPLPLGNSPSEEIQIVRE